MILQPRRVTRLSLPRIETPHLPELGSCLLTSARDEKFSGGYSILSLKQQNWLFQS